MIRSKKILCVDVGNTRTHCALIGVPTRCPERGISASDFKVWLSREYPTEKFLEIFSSISEGEFSNAEAVAYCCVVPKVGEKFFSCLGKSRFAEDFFNLNPETSPMPIDMKDPHSVGQDRIADAVGASLYLKAPYIVVDMGTAVTIDLVDSRGAYSGGAIAPGLHAFATYLSERAAQLPELDLSDDRPIPDIGKDTVEAMRIGCVKGFWKLAQGIISDIENSAFGGGSSGGKTIFTGGSLSQLPKKWLAERLVECNLAPIGLAYSYFLNKIK